ncbi:uncharacterized protein LOC128581378 [Nycticebus coucang]|uniref:uncharacterized protein LOC128581378 n=1 Tax=Nycticebus coucang TaxID=9470 RepID=UPI00234C1D0F|nr:uncharacterized protein LOC128581378 [Nycticebus coucang]
MRKQEEEQQESAADPTPKSVPCASLGTTAPAAPRGPAPLDPVPAPPLSPPLACPGPVSRPALRHPEPTASVAEKGEIVRVQQRLHHPLPAPPRLRPAPASRLGSARPAAASSRAGHGDTGPVGADAEAPAVRDRRLTGSVQPWSQVPRTPLVSVM